ncbi:MAG: tetratricopeptide repeat protein [Bryobacteraceae bacterium]
MLRTVLCLTVSLPLLSQQRAPEIEPALRPALDLHRANDLEGALREYTVFLKAYPASVEARSNLGAVLARLGRYEEAITEYRLALKRAPKTVGVIFNLGLALYKTERFAEAAREFAGVNDLSPGNKQVMLVLADCYLRQGNNQGVVELLERADAEDPAVAYLLGTALIRDNKVERGQKLVDRILRTGDSAEARLLIGTTKMMAREFAEALVDIAKAVELNPKLVGVHSYHGRALLQTGDSAGASLAFRRELETNPNDFDANLNLGALLRQDQSYNDARPYLDRALALRPSDPGVRYQIAALDLATGQLEDARRGLEALIGTEPGFVEAHVTLATVYYRLKRKPDGDRERAVVQKLNAEIQAQQPGVKIQ